MIVDSSALIAIIKAEDDAQQFGDALEEYDGRLSISAATLLEASIVVDRWRNQTRAAQLDALIAEYRIDVVSLTAYHVDIAREAFRKYGKGMGHPARLNFGDCMAYAVAKATGQPLLFKGNDFTHTDIESAIAP